MPMSNLERMQTLERVDSILSEVGAQLTWLETVIVSDQTLGRDVLSRAHKLLGSLTAVVHALAAVNRLEVAAEGCSGRYTLQ
jgi:hypothetical protein